MKDVNLKVDKDVALVDIIGVDRQWETRHRVRALAVRGKSDALAGLKDLQKHHPDDYKKIMKVIRMLASNDRVQSEKHVRQGDTYKETYEMRGDHARLFFFYTPDAEQIVVCTNYYWKAKSSKTEQDEAFKRCEQLRRLYLKTVGMMS